MTGKPCVLNWIILLKGKVWQKLLQLWLEESWYILRAVLLLRYFLYSEKVLFQVSWGDSSGETSQSFDL